MKDKKELQTIKINIESQPLPAGLYLVGTPIGYLKDISLRALETLMSADVIACEDTRVTGKLLHYYGVESKKIKYNDHSDERVREEIFRRIEQGESVALCSDAGLPLIADPGYKLVSECVARGVYVTSIPGANAALTGLQLSGFTTDQFAFLGFIPNKAKAREDYLSQFKSLSMTQVYYETAVRIEETVKTIQKIMGERDIVVARELTKRFEEVLSGTCSEVLEILAQKQLKGEIVLMISSGDTYNEWSEERITEQLHKLIVVEGSSLKESVQDVMSASGWPKKKVYNLALDIKDGK